MKKLAVSSLVLALLLPVTVAMAQQKMDDMKTMDMATTKKPMTEAKMTHTAIGVVKKVDRKAGVVTLSHEAVNSLSWPPMTMGFMVKDKMLFDQLVVDKKVTFEFAKDPKGYVVTTVK